jgi:DNA repair ATPase RecN
MVNSGMGGARRATSSTRATAVGAGQLGSFLAAARDGTSQEVTNWVTNVRAQNLPANELILEIIKEVLPDSGSLDDESLRNAAADALAELYEESPDVDVFQLTNEQIDEVIAITVANEVCNRMDLQLGQAYEKLKYDARQIQDYRNDMREYVQGQVRVVMEQPGMRGQAPQTLAKKVHAMAWKVFGSE